MRGAALSLALVLAVTGQAQALSCLPPDALRAYARADAAPEPYVVLLGEFTFDAPDLPPRDLSDPDPEEHSFPAHFTGRALGPDGFGGDFALDIEVTLGCAGPWCAGLPDMDDGALAFVEMGDAGYRLRLGPCGGQLFADPAPETVQAIEACHGKGACAAP